MSTDSYGYDTDPAKSSGFESDQRPGRAGARTRGQGRGRDDKAPPRRRRKARRVHRVVRHIDIWSLAKIGAVYVACGYIVSMISGFILWRAADIAGTIDGIEGFMEDTGGYDTFEMRGDVVFSSAVLIGAVLSVLAVCLIILAGILFNLISDLTGGIRMTVIDEDLLVTPARRGARPRRVETAPVYEPDPELDAFDEGVPEPDAYEPVADEPTDTEDDGGRIDDDEPETTTTVPIVDVRVETDNTRPDPEPIAPARSWEDPDPDPVAPTRSWDEPEPEPEPAPVPSFRDDAAPSSYSSSADEPAAEPQSTPWVDPVGSVSEPDVAPVESDREPAGGVDPEFERLVAGDSYGSPSEQRLFDSSTDEPEDRTDADEADAADANGSDATDGEDDTVAQDETKPRFEIDFG